MYEISYSFPDDDPRRPEQVEECPDGEVDDYVRQLRENGAVNISARRLSWQTCLARAENPEF